MLQFLRWCRRTLRRSWRRWRRARKPRQRPVAPAKAAIRPPSSVVRLPPIGVEDIRAGIDLERWLRLRDDWAAKAGRDYHSGYQKYFDVDRWLPQALGVARRTRLMEGGRKRVLDIGCGSGLFGHVCQRFGHEFVGLDVGNPMFAAMCDVLDVRFVRCVIERQVPLPEDLAGFDVITTIAPKFNLSEKIAGRLHSYAWDADDWAFFMADLRRRLVPTGVYLIRMRMQERTPAGLLEMLGRGQRLDDSTFILARHQLPMDVTALVQARS